MTAGILRYKRIAQRLREKFGQKDFTLKDLEEPIFLECGTDPRTVKASKEMMLRLKFIELVEQEREFGKPYTEKYKLTQAHYDDF